MSNLKDISIYFFFENVHDDILILLNFKIFVDYENNLSNHFRNIINDNVVKHYMLEVQLDLNYKRFYYKNNNLKNNNL